MWNMQRRTRRPSQFCTARVHWRFGYLDDPVKQHDHLGRSSGDENAPFDIFRINELTRLLHWGNYTHWNILFEMSYIRSGLSVLLIIYIFHYPPSMSEVRKCLFTYFSNIFSNPGKFLVAPNFIFMAFSTTFLGALIID